MIFKKKLHELDTMELMFKLISKARFDIKADLRQQMCSPSYKFYETAELETFKKIGDVRAAL